MSGRMEDAFANFGRQVRSKFSNPAIIGGPEDQLRAPFEALIRDLSEPFGFSKNGIVLIGEARHDATRTRPDYTVSVRNGAVGFIELKAPGKGADPRLFRDAHDKAQWDRLKALPNLLYTDGQSFGLWRDGVQIDRIVCLEGSLKKAKDTFRAPDTLASLLKNFFEWRPTPPETAKQLAGISARLCRYLRDEVYDRLTSGNARLRELQAEWRKLLFPEASDVVFADSYAQAVVFGLLLARVHDISLADGLDQAVSRLRRSDSFIGSALRLLTDDDTVMSSLEDAIKVIITVFETVSWAHISREKQDVWLYFYEDFLEAYDPKLRRSTGSYYTPFEVVNAMVRMVDQVLRGPLFERRLGLASSDVTTLDPACGTGTFILGILRSIADTVSEEQGSGAVPAAIAAAMGRVLGFEIQFGPFSVAQLRIVAEIQHLSSVEGKVPKLPTPRLSLTDTLDNPYVEEEQFSFMTDPVAKSRRDANRIKRETPITVVIGNPPYKEKAEGRGSWIEKGSSGISNALKAPLDWWQPPAAWGVGAHTKHLRNMYVYFWRWATWKVFGSGWHIATGLPEVDRSGIVCFVSVAGFLNGPGFQRMRDDLRRSCSDIWVVDCSPDGHQPEVATRIFGGVQQPVCIVLAARKLGKAADEPARVHFRALPKGRREEKFKALAELSLDGAGWSEGASGWREPFLPEATGVWAEFPALSDLFDYDGSGVMPGRTWVIAPDANSLDARWNQLQGEKNQNLRADLFYPHQNGDRSIDRRFNSALSNNELRSTSVREDIKKVIRPIRYAIRTLDREWIIPDYRLINRPNPTLWELLSENQVFITAPEDRPATNGPAFSMAGCIPDLHHYNGRGGRVYPLWRDAAATQPNVRPTLLAYLADIYGHEIGPEDVLAYIAAVMAHPAFTARFAADLVRPGLRLPLTADRALIAEAVALGREVVWLHCYGERFAEPKAGRPKGAPRLPQGERPTIPSEGAIPGAPEPLPDAMSYDPATKRLRVGDGFVDRVTPAMWAYEVSGKNVLRQWFSYRRRDRTKPVIGDRRPPSALDKIQPDHWPAEYTSDLIDLLNVLGRLVKLESAQADLLGRICDGPLVSAAALLKAGAIVPKPGSDAL